MKNKMYILICIGVFWALLMTVYSADLSGDALTTPTSSLAGGEKNTAEEKGIRFNFHDAPLDTVLDYMSRAAGFVIVRETQVSGEVNVVSHQPLSPDEAVSLLNTILNEEGYTAIRNGRILTIVDRDDAARRNIPVKTGRDPEVIPQTEEMVTQILPVRYANAVKLLENIKPLLPSYAIVSANESSNAIILTDTQSHIRRMAEIVRALDTSISEISTLQVFMLKYADAVEIAKLINELFKVPQTSQETERDSRRSFFRRMRGEDDPSRSSSEESSEALQAASRVVAVADENTNAVVVSAPEEVMLTIEKLIHEIDTSSQDITEVRVFPLKYADAEEMAEMITNIFKDEATTAQTQAQQGRRGFFRRFMQAQSNQQQQTSERKKAETVVLAEADIRTNSVVVSASSDAMIQVERMIRQLDADPSREKKVFVYPLKNADAETVAEMLNEILDEKADQGTGSGSTTYNPNTRGTTSRGSTSRQQQQQR
jgi:general secretion pathway protein D